MSTYPGDDPQQPHDQQSHDQQRAEEPTDTEPTQPVGYYRQQQAGQAQSPYGAPPAQPYPAPQQTPPYAAAPQSYPSGQSTPPAQSYPAQSHPAPALPGPHGGPTAAYGPPPPSSFAAQAAWAGYRPPVPDHPQATTALVLGIVGLVGALMFCGVPLVLSPFAWAIGRNSVNEIRASGGTLGGESQARTGMILGIIGTVLAVLAVLGVIALIVAAAASDPSTGTSTV